MHRPVLSLAAVAAAIVSVSPVYASPLTGNERFSNIGTSQESITTLAPAPRVNPSQNDPQRTNVVMPSEGPRPPIGGSTDSGNSLGKITTSSVSKLVLSSGSKVAEPTKQPGETNPLLEALRWKGANSSQVGVPAELWCADFMNFILNKTGHSTTGSRAARSFLKYGKPVDGPRVGAIVVFTRGGNGQSGHVGIVRGTDGDGNPIVISGNHGHKVAESVYPKHKVLGYFMPPNMEKVNAAAMNAAINSVVAGR